MQLKIHYFAILFFLLAVKGFAANVAVLDKDFSIRASVLYNFIALFPENFLEDSYILNRPVDIGLGFGYKDFFWDFMYALPITLSEESKASYVFDFNSNFYSGPFWVHARIGMFDRFLYTVEKDEESFYEETRLKLVDGKLSGLYVFSSDEFSLRAAYELDRQQLVSAGSFLLGAETRILGIRSLDELLPDYKEWKKILGVGPKWGYAYTFVMNNNFFLNLMALGQASFGQELSSNQFVVLPDVQGRMALGRIGKTWSWNIILKSGFTFIGYELDYWDYIYDASFGILVVRRF